MQVFSENDLDFSFPENWHVIKLDDHEFYRQNIEPIGANLKSVDFLIRHNNAGFENLVFIEVKDFRGFATSNRKRQTNGELIQEVIEKVLHSIIINYLGNYKQIPAFVTLNEFSNKLPDGIHLILFMEEDNIFNQNQRKLLNSNSIKDNIELKIKQRLNKCGTIKFKLLSKEKLKPRDGFEVN